MLPRGCLIVWKAFKKRFLGGLELLSWSTREKASAIYSKLRNVTNHSEFKSINIKNFELSSVGVKASCVLAIYRNSLVQFSSNDVRYTTTIKTYHTPWEEISFRLVVYFAEPDNKHR